MRSPTDIRGVKLPPRAARFRPMEYWPDGKLLDIRPVHGGAAGLVFVKATVRAPAARQGRLRYGSDGPTKVWVNGREVGCEPRATNPAAPDKYESVVAWEKGANEVVFAIDTNGGQAWGVTARVEFA